MAKKAPKGLSASAGGKKKKKAFGGKASDEATNGGSGGGGLGVSKGSPAFSAPRTSLRATTHKGRRVLAARESQLVEDLKNTLLLFGKRTSELVKVSKEREREREKDWSKERRRPFVFRRRRLVLLFSTPSSPPKKNNNNRKRTTRTSWPTWEP